MPDRRPRRRCGDGDCWADLANSARSIFPSTTTTLSSASSGNTPAPMKTGVNGVAVDQNADHQLGERTEELSPKPARPLTRPATSWGTTSPTVPM